MTLSIRGTTSGRVAQPDGKVRIGITDYAQDALGDVVFVQLPTEGSTFAAGDTLGEVESTKSVSEFYAPVVGCRCRQSTPRCQRHPEQLNDDPYGDGWICEIEPSGSRRARRTARRRGLPCARRGAVRPGRGIGSKGVAWLPCSATTVGIATPWAPTSALRAGLC